MSVITPYPNPRGSIEIRRISPDDNDPLLPLPHISFCFITTTPVWNQNAWLTYFEAARSAGLNYSIIYHAGKGNQLFDCEVGAIKCELAPNSWRDTTYVHVNLIRTAQSIGADKAVFLSEYCIPLKPPTAFFNACKNKYTVIENGSIRTKSSQHSLPAIGWDKWGKHEQWGVIDKHDFPAYEVTKANKFLFDHLQKIRFGNEFMAHAVTRLRDGAQNVRSANYWHVSWGRHDAHPMLMVESNVFCDRTNLEVARHPLRSNMSQITAENFVKLYQDSPHYFGRKFHQSVVNDRYLSYISGKEFNSQSIDLIQI